MAKKIENSNTIFLARDMVFYTYKGCSSRDEALDYINKGSEYLKGSGKGLIETFKLSGDYYYFQESEVIGKRDRKSKHSSYPQFGQLLVNKRTHKDFISFILNV